MSKGTSILKPSRTGSVMSAPCVLNTDEPMLVIRGSVNYSRVDTPQKSDYSVWPCRPICEALEWVSSSEVSSGFITGTRNSRGSYWKGEDGDQERQLAARYREWANKLVYEFPYVGRILESIAKSYDDQAGWEDNESNLRRRLPFR